MSKSIVLGSGIRSRIRLKIHESKRKHAKESVETRKNPGGHRLTCAILAR